METQNTQTAMAEKLANIGEVFANITTARRALMSKPFDEALFNELNGDDRGLETLLGRDVMVDFDNAGEVAQLKADIFASLETAEINLGQEAKAALECFCEDLVNIMSKYDAYSTQNADIRTKLVDKLKQFTTKDAKQSLAELKIDAPCFGYTHAIGILEMMTQLVDFFASDTFNLRRMDEISRKQGLDMLQEDKEFLDTLTKVFKSDIRDPGWKKMDVLWGDRLTNASIETLGYDAKKIGEVCKELTRVENSFYKTVRNVRETLCHETETTDEVTVKNTEFYNAVSCVIWFAREVASLGTALAEQIAVMLTHIDTLSTTPPTKKEEEPNIDNPPDDTGAGDNKPDDNQDDNTGNEPEE